MGERQRRGLAEGDAALEAEAGARGPGTEHHAGRVVQPLPRERRAAVQPALRARLRALDPPHLHSDQRPGAVLAQREPPRRVCGHARPDLPPPRRPPHLLVQRHRGQPPPHPRPRRPLDILQRRRLPGAARVPQRLGDPVLPGAHHLQALPHLAHPHVRRGLHRELDRRRHVRPRLQRDRLRVRWRRLPWSAAKTMGSAAVLSGVSGRAHRQRHLRRGVRQRRVRHGRWRVRRRGEPAGGLWLYAGRAGGGRGRRRGGRQGRAGRG
mmetsp:Transcript_24060/g.61694  ORF Transcript_24060/g.61694 Transcript_24060/m.61694 type:complete len:266 (+) Transcript_24060:64-861(+)